MNIGISCDLRDDYLALGFGEEETAEFDRTDTARAIAQALQALGHKTELIGNVWNLAAMLASGRRWDLVFNFAEGITGFGREAQVPALLEAYGIPYTFSDPLVLALTLHKGMTKRVIRDAGLLTPDFAVVQSLADLEGLDLPYPLFAKPVAEGTGKGVDTTSKIVDREALESTTRDLLDRFNQPVLVETFLPGREFTVGITGTGDQAQIVAVMEIILNQEAEPEVYSYVNKEECEERVVYRLVDDAEARQAGELALASYRVLGARDAGRVDIRSDALGRPNFIEINPLAGLHPAHSDLPILSALAGLEFVDLIKAVIDSAQTRIGGQEADRVRTAVERVGTRYGAELRACVAA